MDNLSLIIESYKTLSTDDLVSIANEPESLDSEVIPYLQSELFNRNKKEESIALGNFLIKNTFSYRDLTREELARMIKERVESGEMLESIRLDLKDHGIDIFEIIDGEERFKGRVLDYMTSLKEVGLEDAEIAEKMNEAFNINSSETDILKQQLHSAGRRNVILGYSLVIVSVALILLAISFGGGPGIGGVILIGLGIYKIMQGNKQRK